MSRNWSVDDLNKSSKFFPESVFATPKSGYDLLPFRHISLPNIPRQILLTSPVGEYMFISEHDFSKLQSHDLTKNSDLYRALRTRQIVCDEEHGPFLNGIAAQHATRKLHVHEDPALHIFVVTLRCDHRCHYCQVTPRHLEEGGWDMNQETALAALDRVFESQAECLTIEFQGGEAAVSFNIVRLVVEAAEDRVRQTTQSVRFVLTSTLHLLTDEMLVFCRDHKIELSTSLDGPSCVHNFNRINASTNSYEKTLEAIARARDICGHDSVSALTTITRRSLKYPCEIVDTYKNLGFASISARPLSPFGFAVKSWGKIGYTAEEYLSFYRELLAHLIDVNLQGTFLEETYATLLLTRILTPFPTAYVDLQSPSGAGSNVLVYNYDGGVYVSDEARMLAEMGDGRFRMGSVHDELDILRNSKAMNIVHSGGTAENNPKCSECAFVPYCGADPIFNVATQGDPMGDHTESEFCRRHTGLFEVIFEYLENRDPEIMRVFLSWIGRRNISEIPVPGYLG